MEAQKEVLINKEALLNYTNSFEIYRDIHLPELSKILGVPENECKIKVKGASLDDHITAGDLSRLPFQILQYVSKKIEEEDYESIRKLNEEELNKRFNQKTLFEIHLFKRCVIDPVFTVDEVMKLSEVLPEVVNKVTNEILKMTSLEE